MSKFCDVLEPLVIGFVGLVLVNNLCGHSNNTRDVADDSWILAVSTLFPDVANILVNDMGFEVGLDCNPNSVAQNHFWMEFYHLPLYLQQFEAACWLAYDGARAACAARSGMCTPPGEDYAAFGNPDYVGTWEQACTDAARDVRDNYCPPPDRGFVPFDHGNNPGEIE